MKMVIFIEVIEGPNEGTRFQVAENLTIGRAGADIIVKDPKVSGVHAKFVVDGKGQLMLVDLDSSNGILIRGRRVKKVALLQGVIFEIGRTQFRVVMAKEDLTGTPVQPMTWRATLKSKMAPLEHSRGAVPATLLSFIPAVKLTFIKGIQADQEIILGYGPRLAGSASLDIELLDEMAPSEAFQLCPGTGMVEIKILAPDQVLLNNKSSEAEILKDGDLISMGNTVIKVTYL